MATQAEFYGGAIKLTIGADAQVSRHRAWAYDVTASSGGLAVQLPDARKLIPGYPVIQISNEGANSFAIEDATGATLVATVATDDVHTFALFDNTTEAGDWASGSYTQTAAAPPTPTVFPWTIGGQDTGLITNAWRFDFVADSWSEPGGTATDSHDYSAGMRVAGVAYVANDDSPTAHTESYDPSAAVFASVADALDQRRDAAGAEHQTDDKGYTFGATVVLPGADTNSYDVSGDAWSGALTDMSSARRKHAATQTGADVVYVGGATSFGPIHTSTTDVNKYAPTSDVHTPLTACTFTKMYHGQARDNVEDVWCYGGDESNAGSGRDEVEKYDVSADSWATQNLSPQGAHSGGGATGIVANGMNYTVGGDGPTANDDATYKHNPRNDGYEIKTDHGAPIGNARGISQGNTNALTD